MVQKKYSRALKALNIRSDYTTYNNLVYYDLLNNYVKISSQIEEQINHFSNQFFESFFLIGLQIRTGKMPDRNETAISFYREDHSKTVNESLRIYKELQSLHINSKMYIHILIIIIIDF